jgi:hypothetical protein
MTVIVKGGLPPRKLVADPEPALIEAKPADAAW